MPFSGWSLGGALLSNCEPEVQIQANVSRPDVSWPNEKEEMRKGHKCVWCMQGLMESAFASTLAAEWRHADLHLHHASQEKGNGDGRKIPKLVHFNCRVMNLFSLKLKIFSPTYYLLVFHNIWCIVRSIMYLGGKEYIERVNKSSGNKQHSRKE